MAKFGLKRIQNILSTLTLIIIVFMSGVGMWRADEMLNDTIFTCIWCLSIVMLVDRFDKYDTHNKG